MENQIMIIYQERLLFYKEVSGFEVKSTEESIEVMAEKIIKKQLIGRIDDI